MKRKGKILSHVYRANRRRRVAEAVRDGRSVHEVAESLRLNPLHVQKCCKEFGVKYGRKKVDKSPEMAKWESVDWSLRNADIAPLMGVTQERVRQVRKILKAGKAENYYRGKSFIEFKRWAEEKLQVIRSMTISEIADTYPARKRYSQIWSWCKDMGLQTATDLRFHPDINPDNLSSVTVRRSFRPDLTDCWELPNSDGTTYRIIRGTPAHHLVFRMFNGEIPDGLWVLHICDNKACMNPSHLYAGTPKQNSADRIRHGSFSPRLELDQIREIRERRASGMTYRKIAVEMNLEFTRVRLCATGKTYAEITDPPPAMISRKAAVLV